MRAGIAQSLFCLTHRRRFDTSSEPPVDGIFPFELT